MKTKKCRKDDCFGCRAQTCKVLKESVTDQSCPFYKTENRLETERNASIDRLKAISRDDLIENYIDNPIGYLI